MSEILANLDNNSLKDIGVCPLLRVHFGGVSLIGNGMKFPVSLPSNCSTQFPQESCVNTLSTLNPTSLLLKTLRLKTLENVYKPTILMNT